MKPRGFFRRLAVLIVGARWCGRCGTIVQWGGWRWFIGAVCPGCGRFVTNAVRDPTRTIDEQTRYDVRIPSVQVPPVAPPPLDTESPGYFGIAEGPQQSIPPPRGPRPR